MKKVSIVGTVGIPACYGGFESLVENLTKYHKESGSIQYIVYCSSKVYPDQPDAHNDAKLIYIPLNANGIASIFYDMWSLLHAVFKKSDSILILGVSGCLLLPLIRLMTSAKIITNIDGLEWKRDKWSKLAKFFLKFSEGAAVKFSHVIVADNQAIADYVQQEYSVEAKVIAYGGDHAVSYEHHMPLDSYSDNFALGLCRIEPENNVDMILEAFSKTEKKIKFVGNWNNSAYGLSLKEKYADFANIELINPNYDMSFLKALRSACSFYVHGHSAGGTNPSLVEMMHFGKPVFCFDCKYNRATTEDRAFFFKSSSDLASIISNLNLQNDLSGQKMLEIAQRRYVWRVISEQYASIF